MKIEKNFIVSLLVFVLIGSLFILVSILVEKYVNDINSLIENDFLGIIVYMIITILEVIIAPINLLPLMALASKLWGFIPAALLTLVSWTIGSAIAFWIARKYGITLISKFISEKNLKIAQSLIPKKHLFKSIILIRAFLPFDLLSYALGLFSNVKFSVFIVATFIGFIPIAFIFAYLGVLPLIYQIIGFAILGILLIIRIIYIK